MVQIGACHGNGHDHCCYWPGAPEGPGPGGSTVPNVCPFLVRDAPGVGRRWSCGLYNELGDWPTVHSDPRYLSVVQPLWRGSGPLYEALWQVGVRCGGWPDGIGALKPGQVNSNPELRTLRDVVKAAIAEATQTGSYVNQGMCCWGGQPPEA